MKCRLCGAILEPTKTDLPFKVGDKTIVILKELPVLECRNCTEYLIEDSIFIEVEKLLARVDSSAELEIIHFAA